MAAAESVTDPARDPATGAGSRLAPSEGLAQRVAVVAAELLAPRAGEVDAGTVSRSSLDALAPTGLYGAALDPSVPPAAVRAATEILAGADAATWFVTAQHHLVARYVSRARTPVRDRLGPRLAAGELIGGQGFSQLRRPGPPTLRATRTDGGWRFEGTVPWYTGWGLNDVCLLAGRTGGEPDEAVFAVTPAVDGPAFTASEPLSLLAMTATRTVSLRVDGLVVEDADVVRVLPADRWAAADARRTPNANPALFGVAGAALSDLAGVADRQPALGGAVEDFRRRLAEVRSGAYRLLDEVPDDEGIPERLALRASATRLGLAVTAAAVAAHAGAAMLTGHPAQRRAREALFLAVQAQTPDVRAATVAALAG